MDKSPEIWVGLTGGIATGKSTASAYLQKSGFSVIDADEIVSELLQKKEVIEEIADKISENVVSSKGQVNRMTLGKIVFNDAKKLAILNSIMHPKVRVETELQKNKLFTEGQGIVFNDVPLLFENNLQGSYDQTVLIYCNKDLQLKRLMKRNGFSKDEALVRITSQLDIDDKKNLASVVISNESTLESLYFALDQLIVSIRDGI